MRFVSLAMFLFCIHISMALVNASGIYEVSLNPDQQWIDQVDQDELKNQEYIQDQVNTDVSFDLGDLVKGLFFFVTTFGFSVIVLPATFIQFGVPTAIAILLSVPFYMMYFFGLAQWIANRNEKSMG